MLMAEEGAKVLVNDVGAALDGSGGDTGPAQQVVDEIKKKGGQAIASTLSIGEPAERRPDRQGRARRLRPRRHPGQQRRHPARQDLPSHELVGLVRRDHGASARLVLHEPRLRDAFPRAELRLDDPHDLDVRPDRQLRPGQLHGGEDGHRRPVARHRARHAALQRALQRHRAVRLGPHDRLDPDRDRRREGARRAACSR